MGMTANRSTFLRWAVGVAAAVMVILSVVRLEGYRAGIERVPIVAGSTPATLYRQPDHQGPLVVIAHGFAGSRQLMEAISLTLARAGYAALVYDLQGHGRNPVSLGGDVTSIEGTTARLVTEIRHVVDAGVAATGWTGKVALVGHSMASDIVVRAALAEPRIGPVVAVSMFSGAISATRPQNLLAITGEWEPGLRAVALDALHLIDPNAEEGDTAQTAEVTRRAVVAPQVEHVGVLYSSTTLREARDWLNTYFLRNSEKTAIATTGGWIALLLGSIVVLGWSLAAVLPDASRPRPVPLRAYLICLIVPTLLVPLIATRIDLPFLPVLVADYLAVHLLLYGVLQLAVLRAAGVGTGPLHPGYLAVLLIFGLGGFGFALDRYVASFLPTGSRVMVFGGIALGTTAFMLADTMLKEAGRAALWRRAALFIGFLVSLSIAVWIDIERLMFLVMILPVIVLFFAVFGSMGGWVGRRSGPLPVGLALGLILAWSLSSSFPVFEP